MSRFYDALREASKTQPAEPPEDEWKARSASSESTPPSPIFDAPRVTEPLPVFDAPRVTEPVPPVSWAPESVFNGAAAATAPSFQEPNATPGELRDLAFHVPDGSPARHDLAGNKAKIVFQEQARLLPHSTDKVVLEHYRRLRTKLLQQHETKPFRTVVIASATPQEGKTVTTINLGLSFAMLPGFKVLVIDGDLRRGMIGNWLNVSAEHPGFSDLIEGTASLDDVILRSDKTTAQFIVRGKSQLPPAELLHSPRLGNYLRRASEHFDLILVDSAPLNLVTDAQLLAGHCDAVILAARAFHTTRKSMEQATKELEGFRVLGAVLNGGTSAKAYRHYGYYGND